MSEDEAIEDEVAPPGVPFALWLVGAVVLGVAVASCGMAGFLLVQGGLGGAPADAFAMATRDILPGEAIQQADLILADGLVVPGAIQDPLELVGRVVAEPIYAGDPVLELRLAPVGRRPGVMSLAPKGERSLWILTDAGVGGLGLDAGDHVDLWGIGARPDEVELLAMAARVLAVEDAAAAREARVTLSVQSDEAEAVTRARNRRTELALALRSDRDIPVEAFPDSLQLPAVEPADGGILVARVALVPGSAIAAADLVHLPDRPYGTVDVGEAPRIVGRIPHRAIYAGERVHDEVLAEAAAGRGLGALLPLGDRAVAVSVAGNPLELFPPGGTVDALELDGKQKVAIGEGLVILGIQPDAPGCPCAVLTVPEQLVGPLLSARVRGTLGLALPE